MTLIEFARRTKTYVLSKQLSILINNYYDQYFDVVSYANQHLNVSFESDCQAHELIAPIKKILKNQRITCERSEIQPALMKPFLNAVIGDLLPKFFADKTDAQKQEFKSRCVYLQEIYNVFNSIGQIAPQYKDMDAYVIKRVYELSQNENFFTEQAEEQGLPSDPEIVCSVFCALLDYSNNTNDSHSHYFDNNVTLRDIKKLGENDFAIRNSQPRLVCKPHFELVIKRAVWQMPSVS